MGNLGNILRILPFVFQAIDIVERTIRDKGKAKQDKAVDLVKAFLMAAEGIVGKDLLDDPMVDVALRSCIDSIVAFQNVVKDARAKAKPDPTPLS